MAYLRPTGPAHVAEGCGCSWVSLRPPRVLLALVEGPSSGTGLELLLLLPCLGVGACSAKGGGGAVLAVLG